MNYNIPNFNIIHDAFIQNAVKSELPDFVGVISQNMELVSSILFVDLYRTTQLKLTTEVYYETGKISRDICDIESVIGRYFNAFNITYKFKFKGLYSHVTNDEIRNGFEKFESTDNYLNIMSQIKTAGYACDFMIKQNILWFNIAWSIN